MELFELNSPIKIARDFYIYKIGKPFMKNNIDESDESGIDIHWEKMLNMQHYDSLSFNDGFISLRMGQSMINSGKLSYYY